MKQKLIDHRKACGMSRRFVAKKIGMPYQTLAAKELGYRRFQLNDVRKLAELYNITIEQVAD